MTTDFKCIAVETATEHCSVAAANGQRQFMRHLSSPRDSSREVYAAINAVLAKVELDATQLTCVAFGCGPGSFTGLRIAAGVAQGLAYARNLPVCRVSTLAAIAHNAYSSQHSGPVAVALDARMGEGYFGFYNKTSNDELVAVEPDCLTEPGTLRIPTELDEWLAAGPGWQNWPVALENNQAVIANQDSNVWPDANAVLTLARQDFHKGRTVDSAAALPNYIRNRVTG